MPILVGSLACLVTLPARAGDEAAPAGEEKPQLTWQQGGKPSLAGDVAQLELTDQEAFLDGPQTIKLLARMGNQPSSKEVGMVRSLAEDQDWILVFEWDPAGYVKDDEKDKIDADALLENIREATEEGNDYRKEHGAPGLHVLRWSDPPHYDPETHNLVWGLLARDDNGDEVINYNVRLLGREGFMSITLVDDPEKIESSKVASARVLEGFSYLPGKTYAEWRPGDKVAEYGLAALVAAGAGAAAVKMGLFAKLFKVLGKSIKLVVVGVAALAAAIGRFFRRLFGGGSSGSGGP